MAGRARRYERRIRAGVLSAAAVIVFAAGWIGDEWLMRPAASAPGDVVELVEADRDWDAQVEFASFDDMTLNGVSPAPLTELGHYLSRTETLRAESAVLQRMRYRSNDGRRVSIVLKRDVRSETDEIRFTRLKGRDVAHWSDDVFSVGVIGELPRDELQQVAEQVRSHLADTGSRPAQPRRLVDEAPHGAVSAPGEMITVAGDGPGR